MTSLGDFNAAARELDPTEALDTFGWYGATIRVRPDVGIYPLMRFSGELNESTTDMSVLAIEHQLLRDLIDPDDWAEFERSTISNRVPHDQITELVKALVIGTAGRPTLRSFASADGPPSTTESSTGDSPSPIPPGFEDMVSVDQTLRPAADSLI